MNIGKHKNGRYSFKKARKGALSTLLGPLSF